MSGPAQFESLWTDFLEGDLDDSGLQELNQILMDDPALAECVTDQYQLHRLLNLVSQRCRNDPGGFVSLTRQAILDRRENFVSEVVDRLSPAKLLSAERKRSLGWIGYFAVAVIAVAITYAVSLQVRIALEMDRPEAVNVVTDAGIHVPVNCVATLVFAEDCQWEGESQPQEGERLPFGKLRLRSGMAILRFDGGAAAVLLGKVDVELQSRSSARLNYGELVVRAPQRAAGFLLQTPAAEVVDLGTEFAVKVGRDGATEVHVLEGEVAYRKQRDGEIPGELLTAGNAVRYDGVDVAIPRAVEMKSPRFDELLRQASQEVHLQSLLAYEPFDYPSGTHPLDKLTGGTGWTRAWETAPWFHRIHNQKIDVVPYDFAAFGKNGSDCAMEVQRGIASIVRRFEQPVCLDRNGVYFISMITRWEPSAAKSKWLSQLRVVLRSSANMLGEHVLLNLPPQLLPQIEVHDGEIFSATSPVSANESQLWVGKIVARKNGSDEIFFRIFSPEDPPGVVEPADWNVHATGIRSDAHFDTVVLSAPGPGRRWFDDVRIGTSWRAVVPSFPPRKEQSFNE